MSRGRRFPASDSVLERRRWRYDRRDRRRGEGLRDAVRRCAGASSDGIEVLTMQREEVGSLRVQSSGEVLWALARLAVAMIVRQLDRPS